MAKSYSELLKDPRWQRKRLEIFNRDNWMCTGCGDPSNTLHIHHKIYFKGLNPWEYEDRHLVTLCEVCHENEHGLISEIKEPGRKREHVLIKIHSNSSSTAIQTHIDNLMSRMSKGVSSEIEVEIMKNIIFLQKKRKELTNGL